MRSLESQADMSERIHAVRRGWRPLHDLDGVDRAAAELDLAAVGVKRPSASSLKMPTVLFSWPNAGRPDEDDVVEALELDGAVKPKDRGRAPARQARR